MSSFIVFRDRKIRVRSNALCFSPRKVCLRLNLGMQQIVNTIRKDTYKLRISSSSKTCCSQKNLKIDELYEKSSGGGGGNQSQPKSSRPKNEKSIHKVTFTQPNRCCGTKPFLFFDPESDDKICCGGTLIDRSGKGGNEDQNQNLGCCEGVIFDKNSNYCDEISGYIVRL